jgi:hypothetical protein
MGNLTEEFPALLRTVGKKKFNNLYLPPGTCDLPFETLPVLIGRQYKDPPASP